MKRNNYLLILHFDVDTRIEHEFYSSLPYAEIKNDYKFIELLAWDFLDENGFIAKQKLPYKLEVIEISDEYREEYERVMETIRWMYEEYLPNH